MLKPGLDIFQTFNQVGLQVKRATGGSQQPWVSSSPIDGSILLHGADAERTGSSPRRRRLDTKLRRTGSFNETRRGSVVAGAACHRFCHRGHEPVPGQHGGFSELCATALDDRIDYYGKSTIRAEVLKDKRDTSRAGLFEPIGCGPRRCERHAIESQSSCQVSGLLEFSLSNPANRPRHPRARPHSNMAFGLDLKAAGYFPRTESFNRRVSSRDRPAARPVRSLAAERAVAVAEEIEPAGRADFGLVSRQWCSTVQSWRNRVAGATEVAAQPRSATNCCPTIPEPPAKSAACVRRPGTASGRSARTAAEAVCDVAATGVTLR